MPHRMGPLSRQQTALSVAPIQEVDESAERPDNVEETQEEVKTQVKTHTGWDANFSFNEEGKGKAQEPEEPVEEKPMGTPNRNSRRKSSINTAAIAALGRRASNAIANTIQAIDRISLGSESDEETMQVMEVRRLNSTAYAPWGAFNARRRSQAGPLPLASSALHEYRAKLGMLYVRPGMSEAEDDYTIVRLAKHDDIELMSRWRRWLYLLSGPLIVVTIGVHFWYFILRIQCTRKAEREAHAIFPMAWTLLAAEICVLIPMLLHRLWGLHHIGRRNRPKLRILGENVPSVDVIITCCGEEDDLVLDTAKAACNVDYPPSRFRVIICDDGNSKRLREITEHTAATTQFDNLYYRSRPKYPGVPHHFKAGNLNYALDETKRLPGGAANFFAALDADMIPERDWLRAMIPHMLKDAKCSMTCPPQLFYNVPTDDPLYQSLDQFVHVSEPMKDSLGVAWCTGSGYVMRRAALDSIGGFPIGSLAEDVCTSSMLLGTGWTTAFIHEPLQFGTVPDSLASHLKQRTRWTIGTVQTSLKLRFCIYGPYVRHMTFFQRLCGFVYTFSSLFTIALTLSMLSSPIVLISGGNLVPFNNYSQLRLLMRVWFVTHILNRINEVIAFLPSGYLSGQRDARAVMWMAVFQSLCIIRTFVLPSWLGGKVAVFTSSGSQKAELNERYPAQRAPLWRRLRFCLWDCQCDLLAAFIIFAITSVVLATYWNFHRSHETKKLLVELLTHVGWPPIIWFTSILSCWTPIGYAIWPPDCPDREDLLDRDPDTGVAYPKESAKIIRNGPITWFFEAINTFLTVYTCGLLVASFWI